MIENIYRFGGFANDCSRIAHGFEQIQVQFSVKAWDLTAALIAELAGATVIVDPKKSRTPLSEWKVTHTNPVVTAHPDCISKMMEVMKSLFENPSNS